MHLGSFIFILSPTPVVDGHHCRFMLWTILDPRGLSHRRRKLLMLVVTLLFTMSEVLAKTKKITISRKQTVDMSVYVASALLIFFGILACLYCCKQICPGGLQFSSLELDEIRLERLDDVERGIQQDIKRLTEKLNFHREKKAQIQNKQDFRIPGRDFLDTDALLGNEEIEIEPPSVRNRNPKVREEVKRENPLSSALDKYGVGLDNSGGRNKSKVIEDEKADDDSDMWKMWGKMKDESSNGKAVVKKGKEEGTPLGDRPYAYQSFKFDSRHPSRANSSINVLAPTTPKKPPLPSDPPPMTPAKTPAKADDIMASSPAPSKPPVPTQPPPPNRPPPKKDIPAPAVKVAGNKVSSPEGYDINVSLPVSNYKYNEGGGKRELDSGPSVGPSSATNGERRPPPMHRPGNVRVDTTGGPPPTSSPPPPSGPPPPGIVPITTGNKPPPPRGPPPGFRASPVKPPPPKNMKKDA